LASSPALRGKLSLQAEGIQAALYAGQRSAMAIIGPPPHAVRLSGTGPNGSELPPSRILIFADRLMLRDMAFSCWLS
jgi:hypothetical protein